MNIANQTWIANAVRRLESVFPGYFQTSKHNHNADFGWPDALDFKMLHRMYCRNGLARAGVDKTVLKTWQTSPELWESEEAKESDLEATIRKRFADLRLWQAFAEADRRSMVGGYAGIIVRYRDSKAFDQPVDRVNGGLDGIAEVIPVWAGQLEVSDWVHDQRSEDYGKPKMFRFNEASVMHNSGQNRAFSVHPDRVLVWSADGTVHSRSCLEPGYNDLLDAEKVKGAGGEGFYKSASGRQVLEADKDASMEAMARGMGVAPSELATAMNDQVSDFQSGFDKMLWLQGMTAKTLSITLPSPEHFFAAPVQSYAASINIPMKILVGTQTGERASSEDAADWALVNMARRANQAIPTINSFVQQLERVGILPERDWHINWADLTDATLELKIGRAERMAKINQTSLDPLFTGDEIRGVVGYEPIDATPTEGDEE
jgi:uncharacterized protein